MAVYIQSGAVTAAADRLDVINRHITDDFTVLKNAIASLNGSWDGGASEKAMKRFEHLRKTYEVPRSQRVRDLAAFMRDRVQESYEMTESAVKAAASQFK